MPVLGWAQDSPIADAGISDIFVSKNILVPSTQIRLYARVNNLGTQDITGYVSFYYQGERIGAPQFISIYKNPEEVFTDWIVPESDFLITAKIEGANPDDQNPANNNAAANFNVDPDTDSDGITDYYDTDDDGDGILDDQEMQNGTNPKKADTDADGVNDAQDKFPLNPSEWQDTDSDGTGDNQDSDDDNDGLYDFEEEERGSNPKLFDTDRDGTADKNDAFPNDPKKQNPAPAAAPELTTDPAATMPPAEKILEAEKKPGEVLASESLKQEETADQNPEADSLTPNNISILLFLVVVVIVVSIIIFKKKR